MRHLQTLFCAALLCAACSTNNSSGTAAPATAPSADPPAEAAAATPPAATTASAAAGTVKTVTFNSPALGVDKQYKIYLPAGYEDSGKRYPTLYYLHGLTGGEWTWSSSKMGLVEAADKMGLQAIVVMPDGDDSFYVNWVSPGNYQACMAGKRPFGEERDMATYCVKQTRYGDYIIQDLIPHIDATYRTIAQRSARGVGGLSMGGYGALILAMRHRDVFASTASHSGVASMTYAGPIPYEPGKAELVSDVSTALQALGTFGPHFKRIFGEELDHWRSLDPTTLAAELSNGDLAIYIDCGTEDELRLQHGASYLNEILNKRGVEHEFTLLPGKHDADFWRDRIDDSLAFHMRHLR
ncbi:MAG: alpha/beta hydrolase family protein [Myxococcota bacterium]